MTFEEAKDWCELFTDNLVKVNVDTKKRTLGLQAMQVCKSALKKQIPKKPILDTIFPSGVKWFRCPVCNHNDVERTACYCHRCGQALDWGDSE